MPRKTRLIRTVVGILQREHKILVGQRPPGKPYAGFWEFPGGKIEANESQESALKRELNEELGITVTQAQPWFEHTHAYPDKTVSLNMWRVNAFLGEPNGQENQVLRWVTMEELLALRILEGNWSIIEKIQKDLL